MGRDIPITVLPTTPLDRRGRPLRDLRLSLIDRCNFRCPYCMPADRFPEAHPFLTADQRLSADEWIDMLDAFVQLGVGKLRLTGGEPLLVKGLETLVARIRARWPQLELALTTNGQLLRDRAAGLRKAGLDRITVSLDALDPVTYRALSGGRGDVASVLAGIAAARDAGFAPLKINCVVLRGRNEEEILPLVEHFRDTPTVLRFIEFMDVGTLNAWRPEAVVPAAEIHARIAAQHGLRPLPRQQASDVAERWQLADGSLEIGMISSVSHPFCGDCARARLSADGQLFTCLFAEQGHDLRMVLREGGVPALRAAIAALWGLREDRYSELRADSRSATGPIARPEMYHLGG